VATGKVKVPAGTSPGTYTIKYEICDVGFADEICAAATITVPVSGVTAVPDTDTTEVGTPVTTDVLSNDRPDGGTLDPGSVTVMGDPNNGSTGIDTGTGAITYTPNPGFKGTDTYTYKVCLAEPRADECDTTTVTVSVGEPPAIAAYPDTDITSVNTPVITPVLGNDVAVGGLLDPDSVVQVGSVAGGPAGANTTVTCAAGACTLESDKSGTYTYTYEVCLAAPNESICTQADVTVVVTGSDGSGSPSPGIAASPDSDATPVNTPVTTTVLLNDNAVGGVINPGSVTATNGSHGTTSVDSTTGKVTYTPETDYVGTDTYSYTVCLADPADVCATSTVTIKIGDPAITAEDDASVIVVGSNSVNTDVLANDTAQGGELDPASVRVIGGPANGTTTVSADGSITYTAGPGFDGEDEYSYKVCLVNPKEACATAAVKISGERMVDAQDDTANTPPDRPVTINVLGNDKSNSGSPLDPGSVEVTTPPANGTTTVNADGSVTYEPDADFTGTDTFKYKVCDTSNPAYCGEAEVTVTVAAAIPTMSQWGLILLSSLLAGVALLRRRERGLG